MKQTRNIKDVRIKEAVDRLSREYENAKKKEISSKQELENYERLYTVETELLKAKEAKVAASKLDMENAKKEEEYAENDFAEEKIRLESLQQAEKKAKQKIEQQIVEERRIEEEIRHLVEEENRIKEAKEKVERIRMLYEESKRKFEEAQLESDDELKKVLMQSGLNTVTKNDIKKAKGMIIDSEKFEEKDLGKQYDTSPKALQKLEKISEELERTKNLASMIAPESSSENASNAEEENLEKEITLDEKLKQDLDKEEIIDEEIKTDEEIIGQKNKSEEDLEKLKKDLELAESMRDKEQDVIKEDIEKKESIAAEPQQASESKPKTEVKSAEPQQPVIELNEKGSFITKLKEKFLHKNKSETDLKDLEGKFKKLSDEG